MPNNFESFDPTPLNEQPTDPHADIQQMHRREDLDLVIKEASGERRALAVERLKQILKTSIKSLAGGIPVTTDEQWKADLMKQKEEAEARLRELEENT